LDERESSIDPGRAGMVEMDVGQQQVAKVLELEAALARLDRRSNARAGAASGEKARLEGLPTSVKPYFKSKSDYQDILAKHIEDLSASQQNERGSKKVR
jgi:hypothetical protein